MTVGHFPHSLHKHSEVETLSVYGDGSQTRSFTYVSDTIEGLYKILTSDHPEPFNIGNPEELSVADFASKIAIAVGVELRIENKPLPEDDPKVRKPDISRAKELLNWGRGAACFSNRGTGEDATLLQRTTGDDISLMGSWF